MLRYETIEKFSEGVFIRAIIWIHSHKLKEYV